MKALSLWQPWASAMACGKKQNETRSWATSYRGDLVICSAKRKPSLEECGDAETYRNAMALPYGCALCIVELYRCLPTIMLADWIDGLSEAERELGDYIPDRWVWMTRNLRPLKTPVPVVGRQGLFTLPADVEEQIRAQMT